MPNIKPYQVLPFPATWEDMMARKTMKPRDTLDEVDALHAALSKVNPEYTKYLVAVNNQQAVQGAVVADEINAAQLIKAFAAERGVDAVANLTDWRVVRYLRNALKRYKIGRRQRRIYDEQLAAE